MKCHYAVLGVDRDASADELKKAYRRLALVWHPDKNDVERADECTRQFAVIQQAYDVLSDAHERSWYDRHRDDILHGGCGEKYDDRSLNLFPYFSTSCYSSNAADDDPKNFYTVYRDVFQMIANEDIDYIDGDIPVGSYPTFGNASSDYDSIVGPFYGYWQAYSTAKSYAWLDKYDIRDAPNRRVAGAMEKENRQLRDAGRRARNEQVRELVAFVRKRDQRVVEFRLRCEINRQRQAHLTEENRKMRIRERLTNLAENYREDEAEKAERELHLREIELAINAEFGHDDDDVDTDDDDVETADQLYCIACEKSFRTVKSLDNHKQSKRHRDAVNELKKHMQADDQWLIDDEPVDEPIAAATATASMTKRERRRIMKKSKATDDDDKEEEEEAVVIADHPAPDDDAGVEESKLTEKKKHRRNIANRSNLETDDNDHIDNEQQVTTPKPGKCDTCGRVFDSRTKLFAHIKETNHGTVKVVLPNKKNKVKK